MKIDENGEELFDEEEVTANSQSRDVIDFTSGSPAAPAQKAVAPRKKHRVRKFFTRLVVIAILALAGIFYVRYFNPYAVEARTTGYVTEFEKRGIIFKTFEGTLATESAMGDSARIYDRQFTFTVPDAGLASKLQGLSSGSPRRVTLVYEKYYGMLPWRGGSTNVITDIIDN